MRDDLAKPSGRATAEQAGDVATRHGYVDEHAGECQRRQAMASSATPRSMEWRAMNRSTVSKSSIAQTVHLDDPATLHHEPGLRIVRAVHHAQSEVGSLVHEAVEVDRPGFPPAEPS